MLRVTFKGRILLLVGLKKPMITEVRLKLFGNTGETTIDILRKFNIVENYEEEESRLFDNPVN